MGFVNVKGIFSNALIRVQTDPGKLCVFRKKKFTKCFSKMIHKL